jgi:hypothetical protein
LHAWYRWLVPRAAGAVGFIPASMWRWPWSTVRDTAWARRSAWLYQQVPEPLRTLVAVPAILTSHQTTRPCSSA